MKTVKFKHVAEIDFPNSYYCSDPGDHAGEYVKAELVADLARAAMNYYMRCPSAALADLLLETMEAMGIDPEDLL
jgi:hypothetical protein